LTITLVVLEENQNCTLVSDVFWCMLPFEFNVRLDDNYVLTDFII